MVALEGEMVDVEMADQLVYLMVAYLELSMVDVMGDR